MLEDKDNFIPSNDAALQKLQKELRINRIFTCIASVLMICLLVGGIVMYLQFKGFLIEVDPILTQISKVDFQAVNQTLDTINSTLSQVDWGQLSAQLNALDIDAVNEAIAGLNTEELSQSLETLNDIVESLETFSETIKSFLSKFSFGLPAA